MRAFIASVLVLAAISIGAAFGLGAVDMSSSSVFSSRTGDVRL